MCLDILTVNFRLMATGIKEKRPITTMLEFPTSSIRRILGVVGLTILGIVFFHTITQEGVVLAEFFTQLSVALVLMMIGILYWMFKPQIEQLVIKMNYDIREKKTHTQELNLNFFQRMTTIEFATHYIIEENGKKTLTIRDLNGINYEFLEVPENKEYTKIPYQPRGNRHKIHRKGDRTN